MKKVKVAYEMISIEDLYVNPENDRYINDSEDEISAMIDMFRVANGNPRVEMVNLAEDSELPKKLTLNKLALIGKAEKSP